MENYWKACAIMILTVVLGAARGKTEKDLSVVLTLAACCIILMFVGAWQWYWGSESVHREPSENCRCGIGDGSIFVAQRRRR